MSLQEKIDQDLKQAMAAKDATRLSTLRFLKSALKYSAIEKKKDTLTDTEAREVIQKQIKQRRESIEQFSRAGRGELAQKEKDEAKVLEGYLPAQLSDAELGAMVKDAIQSQGAASKKDFGRLMKYLNEKIGGRAAPARVSEVLGKLLP